MRWKPLAGAAPILFTLTYGAVADAQPGVYPGTPTPCVIDPNVAEVEVYFEPAALTTTGADVDAYRAAFQRALNVWNEEAHSSRRLRYIGDATKTTIVHDNQIIVTHKAVNARCGLQDDALAFAPGVSVAGTCVGPVTIEVYLNNCASPPQPIPFTPH